MNAEARLASIHRALLDAGLQNLVMGGHAVRFYGIDRHTLGDDFMISVDDPGWHELGRTIAALERTGFGGWAAWRARGP